MYYWFNYKHDNTQVDFSVVFFLIQEKGDGQRSGGSQEGIKSQQGYRLLEAAHASHLLATTLLTVCFLVPLHGVQLAPFDSLPFQQLIAKLILSLTGLFTVKGLGRSNGLCLVRQILPASVWQCQVSHCAEQNGYRPAPWKAETLPASLSASGMCSIVSSWSLGYLAVIQSPSAMVPAASSTQRRRTVTGRGHPSE